MVLDECKEKIRKEKQSLEERTKELEERESNMKADLEEKEKQMKERVEKELEKVKTTLAEEKQEWEEEKEKIKRTKTFEKIVTLNVGGTKYTTSLSTLTKYPDSMLGAMFSGRHALLLQEDGSYFVDVDGEFFRYVLLYLRDREHGIYGLSVLPAEALGHVRYLSRYLQLQELETFTLINEKKRNKQQVYSLHTPQIQENPADSIWGDVTYSVTSHQYAIDYEDEIDSENKTLTCTSTCCQNYQGSNIQAKKYQNAEFKGKIEQCNLTDVQFLHCHFGEGFSFEGSILHNTVFEYCSGLVTNKVHFAPWQVSQAKFQPELLKALKDNGCIY